MFTVSYALSGELDVIDLRPFIGISLYACLSLFACLPQKY